jgi:serine protease Do
MGIIQSSSRAIAGNKIFPILVFVYALLLYAAPVSAQRDFSALYKIVAPSVVTIGILDTKDKLRSGTGFFIREDGLLVTNYHVIEDYVEALVKLSNGEFIPIERIIAEDRKVDLALLKLRGKKRCFPRLRTTDTKIEVGQPVVVIGGPMGLEGTIADGIISAIREISDVGKVVQITAPVSPGSSGSPVVNIKGEVVGIAVAFIREGQSLNFAIPAEKLNRLLSHLQGAVKRNFVSE